jgi:hypothetical protein
MLQVQAAAQAATAPLHQFLVRPLLTRAVEAVTERPEMLRVALAVEEQPETLLLLEQQIPAVAAVAAEQRLAQAAPASSSSSTPYPFNLS